MSWFPPTHSPRAAWRDLRAIMVRRSREQTLALALSLSITMVIVFVFFIDSTINTAPPMTVTYVDSWSANRTDAQIEADQKKDQAANEKRARARQEQFKEIANTLGIEE